MTLDLPQALSAARASMQMKKAELARRLNVSASAVGQYESGKIVPSTRIFMKLHEVLNINLEEEPFKSSLERVAAREGYDAVPVRSVPRPSEEPRLDTALDRGLYEQHKDNDPEIVNAPLAKPFEKLQGFARDVPVIGTAIASDRHTNADFSFNGQEVDRAMRPPGLAQSAGVFALYVMNDSMYPAWKEGSLFYVNPNRPPAPGDDVVVELHPTEDGTPGRAYFKRLVSKSSKEYVVEQFNPSKQLIFQRHEVRQILRVVPWEEALGLS